GLNDGSFRFLFQVYDHFGGRVLLALFRFGATTTTGRGFHFEVGVLFLSPKSKLERNQKTNDEEKDLADSSGAVRAFIHIANQNTRKCHRDQRIIMISVWNLFVWERE